jgi:NADPH-dependent glutamate synthase beta subunit-like oxidoreductase/ferredoxin
MVLPRVPDADWLWANEPCRAACPVHTDAGAYVTAIAEGDFERAYLIARAPNPFPSVCGRVCAAPCERACRRGSVDAPVSIRALKRFVTERFGVESFNAGATWHAAHGDIPPASLLSIGVIGGGPAGLAAACELRLAGHPVVVYEAQERLGGMMVLGIPEYRLPRALITREIEAIVEVGIDVETNARIGETHQLVDLLDRHAALFLAVGTGTGRDLDLPGHELDGVLRAVEYLLNVNQGFRVDLGERVVVVGGGNVAFDAARTALRASSTGDRAPLPMALDATSDEDARRAMTTTLDVARAARRAGVLDVTIVALESPTEIPADPEEIDEAEREGIRIVYRKGPHRFVGDRHVTGLETIAVTSVFDADGRFAPTFAAGTEDIIPADTVILAVGQAADLNFLGGEVDLERTPAGGICIDPDTLRTSDTRIWAGGDVARGPRNLIDAIADGKRAAASIHAALTGAPVEPRANGHEVRVALRRGFRRLDSDYDAIPRQSVPATPTDRRVGFGEVETGYDEREARLEGLRCLRCFDNVMLSPELCILCGLCVDVCPPNCITIVRADRVGAGTAQQSVLLLDEDLCIRCGLCVNRCPPGALSMVHAEEIAHA